MAWPILLEHERPKNLYHEGASCTLAAEAVQAGWTLVDVRSMPSKNDEERRTVLKCILEGIRMGSIIPDPKKLKFLELEAKVLGMIGGKGLSSDPPDDEEVNALLSTGGAHV
jgi:hypothetical protein